MVLAPPGKVIGLLRSLATLYIRTIFNILCRFFKVLKFGRLLDQINLLSLWGTTSPVLNMNYRKHGFVFLVFLSVMSAVEAQVYSKARIHLGNASLSDLGRLGIAVDHVHLGPDFVEGDFSQYGLDRARSSGYWVEIIESDPELAYQQNKPAQHPHARTNAACIAGLQDFGFETPKNFQSGSYQGNFTYAEMQAELDRMQAIYPHLISGRADIGDFRTFEGRPIQWIRISDNPNIDEPEPEILYTSLHHAREPISLTQLIYFMWYLLENAGTDADIRRLLEETELYFIPCVNPDGYVYNETQRPEGGGLWRKNRRPNGDGSFGVDLNRNYGHKWGLDNDGSSNDPKSEVYRGMAPFSEPETQAVRAFVLAHDFKLALNYHSYGGFLIYPYGYTSQPVKDLDIYQELAFLLTKENRYIYGTGIETVFYRTNGDADDWMYGEQDEKPAIFAMTPEVGTKEHGFWPHSNDVEFLCQAALHQNLQGAFFLLNSAMIIDESELHITEKRGSLPLRITKLGFEETGLSLVIKPLTQNIQFEHPSKFYILSLFARQREQLTYELSPDIQDGERIKFAYTLDNGTFTITDTIVKYYQEPRFVLNNQGEMDGWQTGTLLEQWGSTNKIFYSAPSSLTDSPNGNYIPYSTNYLTLKQPVSLGDLDSAILTFKALWDIQHRFDYLQIEISTNNVDYMPLCGKYSTPGVVTKVLDQPIYSGRQLDWVSERIDLTEYLGQEVIIRFGMISTHNDSRDGFYLDEIKILQYNQGSITSVQAIDAQSFQTQAVPNPAQQQFHILTTTANELNINTVEVYNHVGQKMASLPYLPDIEVNAAAWPAGFYFYRLIDAAGRSSKAEKIVVRR